MDPRHAVFWAAILLASVFTLAGLVVRGRARHCLSFVAYLSALVTTDALALFWQSRFFNADFWIVRQALLDVLKTAVGLELAWRVVRSFPGALRTARVAALLLLVGSVVVLFAARSHSARYDTVLFAWQPRVVASTALLFTLTALLVAWYHLPIRRLHRALMGGFAVYLAFFVTLLGLLGRAGWGSRATLGLIDQACYLGVMLVWARAVWAREEEPMPQLEELVPVPKGVTA